MIQVVSCGWDQLGASDRAATASLSGVDRLRRRAVQGITLLGWLSLCAMTLAGRLAGLNDVASVLAIGTLTLLLPSWISWHGRFDGEARLVLAVMVAVLPALLVYLLRGHSWQMDGHMYFFVALAALAALCDWRPIVVAAVLIALHHLALVWLAPDWVFSGSGRAGRVIFHAAAVALQCIVLTAVAEKLGQLVIAQEAAVTQVEATLVAAQYERARAEEALAIARAAETHAASERQLREEGERRAEAGRRDELLRLGRQFEGSVSAVARSLEVAFNSLDHSAGSLDTIAQRVGTESREVARSADDASGQIRQVASAVAMLGDAAATIAAAAEQQRTTTTDASNSGQSAALTISRLVEEAQQIRGFVDDIRQIAATTNLLALNATIEAARAGEAGRGFTVVAAEVKTLAGDAGRAADRIADLLASFGGRLDDSTQEIALVASAVCETAAAARAVADAVETQRLHVGELNGNAARAADSAASIEMQIDRVSGAVVATAALSSKVRGSIATLGSDARELRAATDRFMSVLTQAG